MTTPRTKAPAIAVKLLNGILRGSGLSHDAFAAKVGISPATLTQARRGWQLTARMTRRIEAACGCAIWTSNAEFARQQSLTAWLGLDPFLVHYTKAAAGARAKGVFIRGRNPSKALVFARLFSAFEAAHPAPQRGAKRGAATISTVGNPPPEKAKKPNTKRTP